MQVRFEDRMGREWLARPGIAVGARAGGWNDGPPQADPVSTEFESRGEIRSADRLPKDWSDREEMLQLLEEAE
jgi:hypothetical protein